MIVLNLLVLAGRFGIFFGSQNTRIWKKLKYDIKVNKIIRNNKM